MNFFPFNKILFCVCLFTGTGQAQDWQVTYEKATEEYQVGSYEKALSLSQALFSSVPPDQKSRAYLIQLITSNCLMLNKAEEGLKYVKEEISLFQQTEGIKSQSLAEALKKEIIFLQMTGLGKEALQKATYAEQCFMESYGPNSLQYVLFCSLKGEVALSAGDSSKSKQIWEACLVPLQSFPKAHTEYKSLLTNTAALEESLKDYVSAKENYGKLVSLLDKNQPYDTTYAEAKLALARLDRIEKLGQDNDLETRLKVASMLQKDGQIEEAMKAYQTAEEVAIRLAIKDEISFSVFMNSARLQLEVGAIQKALSSINKAQDVAASILSDSSRAWFILRLTNADILLASGDHAAAMSQYLDIAHRLTPLLAPRLTSYLLYSSRQLVNTNIPVVAAVLLKLLVLNFSTVQKKLTESDISIALTFSECKLAMNQPDSVLLFLSQPLFSSFNLMIALKRIEALQLKGEWTDALSQLKLLEKMPMGTNREVAEIDFQIGRLLQKMGRYSDAEGYYRKAATLFDKDQIQVSWQVVNALAILYLQLGDYLKSEKELLSLIKKVPASNPLHSTLQRNLAANYIESNQLKKAIILQEQIVQEDRQELGENHPDYVMALGNLGAALQKLGDYDGALLLFKKAADLAKSNFGEQSVEYAVNEINLGNTLKDLGEVNQASRVLLHANNVLAARLGRSHPDFVVAEYNLAMVYKRTGDVDLAIPLMKHISDFYKNQILTLFPAMNEHEQFAFYNKINKPIQDYLQFAVDVAYKDPQLIEQLFDFRLTTKALLLNSSVKIRQRILSGDDSELKNQFLTWLTYKDQLGKMYNSSDSDKEEQIARLEALATDLEKKLSSESQNFRNETEQRSINLTKIQHALNDDEAAIEFIRLRANGKKDSVLYAAILVRKDRKPQLIVLSNGREMEGREFSFYRNNIIHQQLNQRSFKKFWEPLDAELQGIQTIYVSADGVYNKINLSTLFDPIKREYLNGRYRFIILSNLRDKCTDFESTPANKVASLFGFPSFGNKPTQLVERSSSLLGSLNPADISPLPGTKIEVDKIGELLESRAWSLQKYTGGGATESNLKALKSSAIVHIATHGFFIASSDSDEPVNIAASKDAELSPLLRSGLVFSDVNSPTDEDGLLTAYEVKNLSFENTDLVVLSACETGSGEIKNGEGVYGLQRSFLLSGAKNIVMSLWKVDDLATQELMVLLYSRLLEGKDKSEALRLAQMELMKTYKEPYYWGGFVLIGKPN